MVRIILFSILATLSSCMNTTSSNDSNTSNVKIIPASNLHPLGKTVAARINAAKDYTRTKASKNSFESYLRSLPLKPHGSLVKYHDGSSKQNIDVYEAVIDLPIGKKNLHQCADAIMRLKAEYLWHQKQYEKIHFNFTNGHNVEYIEWMQGKRIHVEGNKSSWIQKEKPSNDYRDFWNYMEVIFTYAGTSSMAKEMISTPIEEAEIGDVLIQGGHPGHAVIIIDKAVHKQSGKAIFLLAQSYMPAQDLHILKNPKDNLLSPWYEFDSNVINTPEWKFNNTDLKKFR